jgi:hypothetical protein
VDYWAQYSSRFHYDDLLSVFLLVAAAQGARRLLRLAGRRGAAGPAILALPLVVALLAQFVGHSLLDQPGKLMPDAEQRRLLRQIEPFKALPPGPGIAADATLGPHFAARDGFVPLFDDRIESAALDRLGPGGLVLLTPLRRPDPFKAWLALLQADPRFRQVLDSALLGAFERLPDPAAP